MWLVTMSTASSIRSSLAEQLEALPYVSVRLQDNACGFWVGTVPL